MSIAIFNTNNYIYIYIYIYIYRYRDILVYNYIYIVWATFFVFHMSILSCCRRRRFGVVIRSFGCFKALVAEQTANARFENRCADFASPVRKRFAAQAVHKAAAVPRPAVGRCSSRPAVGRRSPPAIDCSFQSLVAIACAPRRYI